VYEKMLWNKLRNKKLLCKFYRQYGIGPHILDFYCPSKKVGIELDGSYHKTADAKEYDKFRKIFLGALGIRLLRFWNRDVEDNLEEVIKEIQSNLNPL
jgi:very-short-patch-repair endonuclease